MWIKQFVLCLLTCFALNSAQAAAIFHDAKGNKVSESQFSDKWIVVNYWATWCESCLSEISELNKFYKTNSDKKVLFYGVNYDHLPMKDLKEAIKKVKIGYPVLVEDPTTVWNLSAMDVIPTTFIIDPKGKVVKTIVGPTSAKMLASTLHSLQQ